MSFVSGWEMWSFKIFTKLISMPKEPIEFDESRFDIMSSISMWATGDRNIELALLFLR